MAGTTNDAVTGDPLLGFQFAVELSGAIVGYFTEVSGLGSENEVIEHKIQKDGKEIVRKIPGRLKWGDITLKRGVTTSMDIYNWRKLVEDGKPTEARKNGAVIMMDRDRNPLARWDFEKGWPSKATGPSLKSDGNEVAMEEIVIVHEYIKRTK